MSDVPTRWLTGAALCLIAMVVLTDALNQFGAWKIGISGLNHVVIQGGANLPAGTPP